jgi:hypothetical protein
LDSQEPKFSMAFLQQLLSQTLLFFPYDQNHCQSEIVYLSF